jgi:hypothetical protein
VAGTDATRRCASSRAALIARSRMAPPNIRLFIVDPMRCMAWRDARTFPRRAFA